MFLKRNWRRINLLWDWRFNAKDSLDGVHSVQVFRATFQLERARANRYGDSFSLALFSVGSVRKNDVSAKRLAHVLRDRKRSTDQVGWLGDRYIAVILPNTTSVGAESFAKDVIQKLGIDTDPRHYRIYEYPLASVSEQDDRSHSDKASTGGSSANSAGPASKEQDQKRSGLSEILGPLLGRGVPLWKRAIDIIVSLGLLVILSPLFLLLAAFIKIVSPGPVFFKQRRAGYLGKPFTCWKFRTMNVNADTYRHEKHSIEVMRRDRALSKLDNDPQIIPGGKLIRKCCLDEFAQLINVLRGDMSLVGPRPEPVYVTRNYNHWHRARLDAVPGMTGLWQVSGKNRTTFSEMIRLDIRYGKRRSIGLDLRILLMTVPAILRQVSDTLLRRQESGGIVHSGASVAEE